MKSQIKYKTILSSSKFHIKFTFSMPLQTLQSAVLETYKKEFYGLNTKNNANFPGCS